MKFYLLALAATAATVFAAPAEKPASHLARDAPEDLIVTTDEDGLSATATPVDSNDGAQEKRDLASETHDLAKRWMGNGGWISCGGQWWEYGEKRVAIQYTGIFDDPVIFRGGLAWSPYFLSTNNWQAWWRTDKNVMEINWSFPEKETAKQIEVFRYWFGITCRW